MVLSSAYDSLYSPNPINNYPSSVANAPILEVATKDPIRGFFNELSASSCNGTVGGTDDDDDFDGDGVCNDLDLDDDNDGIKDEDEIISGNCILEEGEITVCGTNITSFNSSLIDDNITAFNNSQNLPIFNEKNDYLIADLGQEWPAGTVLQIYMWKTSTGPDTNHDRRVKVTQLSANCAYIQGNDTNPLTINNSAFPDNQNNYDVAYTISAPTQYIQFRMIKRTGGSFRLKELDIIICDEEDFDGDDMLNRFDLDSDNDGITDIVEAGGTDTNDDGIVDGVFSDTNENGWSDVFDPQNGGGGTPHIDPDSDGDGFNDRVDLDSDNDGITDLVEAGGTDSNGDGIVDGTFTDPDGDGWSDVFDPGDNNGGTPHIDPDSDGDGFKDRVDLDADNDGLPDIIEAGGTDTDSDGIVDGVFADTDGDGWSDIIDVNNGGTAHTDPDSDDDGQKDRADLDSDHDGIPDIVEAGGTDVDGNGIVDGIIFDTDQDGWSNVFDSDNGGTAHTDPDSDSDGLNDRIDLDSDNDGIPDIVEAQSTFGYVGISGIDSDGDGIDNAFDPENGATLSSSPLDTDGTGDPDYLDLDSDDDGVNDIDESGSGLTDANNDGRTDGDVGDNGLDVALEAQDDFIDPDGNIDVPKNDLADEDNDAEYGGDVNYRDIVRNTPGGVDAEVLLWLRADKGSTSWSSFSPNVEITPEGAGSISAGNLLNFNNTNDFDDGYYQTDLSINAGTVPKATIFSVYVPDEDGAGTVWGEKDSTVLKDRWLSNSKVSTGNSLEEFGSLERIGKPSLATIIFDEDVADNSAVYVDGNRRGNFSSDHYIDPDNTTSNPLQIGAKGDNGNRFKGRIAEVIVFSEILNGSNRKKVESYLALKYGITLFDNTAQAKDYTSANGTTLWNSTTNASYHHNVAGIFRDDISYLEQKQSKSIDSTAIVTIGLDNSVNPNGLESSNVLNDGTFSSDVNALLWGHDNADINGGPGSAAETEYDPIQVNARLNREWKVQETGETGIVTIEIDVSGLLGPDDNVGTSDESQIVLLVDADGDFSSGASMVAQSFTMIEDGKVVFSTNLSNGSYFTLGSSELGALPITLLSFDTHHREDHILIEWITTHEEDNSYFKIQHSSNGIDFQTKMTKNAAISPGNYNVYHIKDYHPTNGYNYYRLIDVDRNGSETVSETKRTRFIYQEHKRSPYPNPLTGNQNLSLKWTHPTEPEKIMLYTNNQSKLKVPFVLTDQNLIMQIPKGLANGMYILHIRSKQNFWTHKISVSR